MKPILPINESILVFLHTKKTAGISLQLCLAKQFGKKFYGGHTHGQLSGKVAKNPLEIFEIKTVPNGGCICKHWPAFVYDEIKDRCNFITIFRDPVDRIKSHYNFYRKHFAIKYQSFKEYIRDPKNINLYTKQIPDRSILSEVFLHERLEGIKNSDIISCKVLPKTNKTKYIYKPSKKEIAEFMDLNSEDIEYYQWAKQVAK